MMSPSLQKIAGNQRGFTLIELMIVVVLIGILTSIAFPLYGTVQSRARVAKARADVRTLASAAAVYAAHAGTFPASLNNLTVNTTVQGKRVPPTMKAIPTRPSTTWSNYTYTRGLTKGVVNGTFTIVTSSSVDKATVRAP